MPATPDNSRRQFEEYRRDVQRRRAAGEFQVATPAHSVRKGPPPPRSRSSLVLLKQFFGLLRGHRLTIAFSLATLSIATMMKLTPPAATKIVIDFVLPGKPLPSELTKWLPMPVDRAGQLWTLAIGLVMVAVVGTAIHLWSRWHATRTSKHVQVSVRRRAFQHAVRLPLDRVYQLKSGGVASILREDAGGVSDLIFSLLYNPFRAIVQLLGSLAVLAWIDWRLLLGALVLLPLVFFTHRTWIGRIRPLYRDIRRQRQEVDGHVTEAFGGMRVVRGFGRGRSETGRFTRGNHLMARQELHAWWWARAVELVWDTLLPLASAALLVYGGSQVMAGRLSMGGLMMFLIYLAMLLAPLAVLANSATALQNSLAGLDRVIDLLEDPVEMPDRDGAILVDPARVAGRITLRNVDFRYPNNSRLVLENISLDIEPGQMVALVGPSGAGKTTLCNLIARFYDVSDGSIRLDGTDLRDLQLDGYRRLLGIVEQDVFLFDGTVADNIGYALRGASRAAVQRAALVANAHEFIDGLPDGYDSVIGERGVRLSGGQRQRIAIARAVLADPRILILDEATSNLDTQSERLIQQSLGPLLEGRTSLVIAHRLSTITHADQIVVLEEGRIVETGTHSRLMAASGRYRQMVGMQLGRTAIDQDELLKASRD